MYVIQMHIHDLLFFFNIKSIFSLELTHTCLLLASFLLYIHPTERLSLMRLCTMKKPGAQAKQ